MPLHMTSRHSCGGHYNSQVPQAQSMFCVHFKVRLNHEAKTIGHMTIVWLDNNSIDDSFSWGNPLLYDTIDFLFFLRNVQTCQRGIPKYNIWFSEKVTQWWSKVLIQGCGTRPRLRFLVLIPIFNFRIWFQYLISIFDSNIWFPYLISVFDFRIWFPYFIPMFWSYV